MYLDSVYQQLETKTQKHIEFIFKDQSFIRDSLEEIGFKIGIRCKNIELKNPDTFEQIDEWKYLLQYLQIFSEYSKCFLKFQQVKDEFIKPINDTLFKEVKDQNIADELFYINKRVLSRLNNIEKNSNQFSTEMIQIIEQTIKPVESLKKEKDKIDQIKAP